MSQGMQINPNSCLANSIRRIYLIHNPKYLSYFHPMR